MDSKIKVRQALRVFNRIVSEGQKKGASYQMNGINAETGFDGYTVSLFNDYVRLDIFFHNKHRFEFTNAKERDGFLDTLARLDKAKPQS